MLNRTSFYRSLTPRTRMLLGGGVMAYALVGLYVTGVAEETLGLTASEDDRRRLREIVPTVRVVEREE